MAAMKAVKMAARTAGMMVAQMDLVKAYSLANTMVSKKGMSLVAMSVDL